MKVLTVNEFYLGFQKYIESILNGEYIILSKRNKRIAVIEPIKEKKSKRPFGLCKGEFSVPSDFNKPLPKSVLESFYK